jgi:phosphoribosylamine---glycine ligase
MRFLGIGEFCELGSLYLRLLEEGHEVKVWIADPKCHGVLNGLVERVDDWRKELSWVGSNGILLFENVTHDRGALQDELRRDGFQVIGGSAFGDRLENDRGYAQRILGDLGMQVSDYWEFSERAAALDFIAQHPRRYVLKFNATIASVRNYVGRFSDGRDVQAVLAKVSLADGGGGFILMEHVDGVEMGVGAYFNGDKFLTPACLDWEHKRFFPGDMGELTGEMGTVVTYDRTAPFFNLTLRRLEPLLRQQGYCGYINLNTIVNERGIWPLEFTCRFGYPGFAILQPLQEIGWATLFQGMIRRSISSFPVAPGYCVGIVVTTPPFPYERPYLPEPVGLPVLFEGAISPEEKRHLHYGEVGVEQGELVTAGIAGWTMVVTGVDRDIAVARERALGLADRVLVPNARYRRDIGERLIKRDLLLIERLGLLG